MSKSVRDLPVGFLINDAEDLENGSVVEIPEFVWDSYVEEPPISRTDSHGNSIHYITEGAALARHARLIRTYRALEKEFSPGRWFKTDDREWALGNQKSLADYRNTVELFESQGGKVVNEFNASTWAFPDGDSQFIYYSEDILERCVK